WADPATLNRLLALGVCWSVATLRLLRLRQERYRREWAAVAVASRDAIVVIDPHGVVREWNAQAESLYGRTAAEVIGASLGAALGVADDTLGRAIANVCRGRIEETFHDEHRTADGRLIIVAITLSPVRESGGRLIGVSAIVRDVTLEMRAQRVLVENEARYRDLASSLDQAASQKNSFISMLGHELRNPLGAIGNAAGVLRLVETRSARGQRALEIIESQVALMRRQLDDLLTLSRIDRGELELKRSAVRVEEIVSMAVDAMREHLTTSGLTVEIGDFDPALRIHADKFRIGQVMLNLLDNAAKFTESRGRIRIDVDADEDNVRIHVADQGVGIDPALLPYVFDEFTQAEQHISRQSGGMGLGLAIVRNIVELHDGSIAAESEGIPGRGTRFIVTLPRQDGGPVTEPGAAHGTPANAARTRFVMIADDNVEALQALSDYLELNGYRVAQAIDGEAVLHAIEDEWPDVLVLDIGLPGRDGLEIAREVRTRHGDRHCVLIAITGYGSSQMAQKTRAAGFDHHLVKPVSLEQLRACLD
ncbi:MAG: ATP-binding protein, partial [Gammaproteobacteria bacterium]